MSDSQLTGPLEKLIFATSRTSYVMTSALQRDATAPSG